MRVTQYLAVSAALVCGAVLPFLTGCGGSDDNPTPTPTASASPVSGSTSAYAGKWAGSFTITTVSNVSVSGPANFVISDNGTFSATLQNDSNNTQGVLTKKTTRTVSGTLQSSGFYTGTITVDGVTDTVSGTLSTLVGSTGRLRGTLNLTHAGTQSFGSVDVSSVD